MTELIPADPATADDPRALRWVAPGAVSTPVFSTDGQTLWHLRGAGVPQVWQCARDGSAARALTEHGEKTWKLARAPTDDRLLWAHDAGGDEAHALFLRSPDGAVRALTAAPGTIHNFGCFSPDGALIAYAANDRDPRFFDILTLDLATGARRRVLEGQGILTAPAWSPAARPGAPALVVMEDISSAEQRLHLLDLDNGRLRPIPGLPEARFSAVKWEKSGTALLVLTDAGADFIRLVRLDPETGAMTPLFAPEADVEAWSLSPDGALLATVENDRGSSRLRVGPADGARPVVAGLPEGIVADLAWAPDGALAFSVAGPATPPAIWILEGGAARCLLAPEPPAPTPIPFALVSWKAADGRDLPGFYATPRGPAPAGGWPAVVWVHGGPAAQTRANFRPDMQMLLEAGFAVLMPNLRGSTGYGRAWMLADELERRPIYLDDLAATHAFIAARPEIDAARIGIMGQSYGGYAVLAALTLQPDLWQAGVDYYGIADFATLLTHTSPWRADHRAREYGYPDAMGTVFDRICPLRHAAALRAPLLVLHADRDPRVPLHESELMVAELRRHGRPVRYERLSWAGHGFNTAAHRAQVYSAVLAHFRTHLGG